MSQLSVIGLGKLGACTAACFAAKGFEVIGIDINESFVAAINEGKAPVQEPRLQEMIDASKGRLVASQSFEQAIEESEVSFLIVPTPSQDDHHFSDRYLQAALTEMSKALKESSKSYHLFVVTSTVSPGAIEKNLIPLIEKESGRKLNEGFGVCYNPEFIALGSVINDFLKPDMVLIGEGCEKDGARLESIYRDVCENTPYVARMSLVSSEITKISLNSYVTMKISFANTLANLCERIPGADVDDISKALGADKRISPYYIKGGLAFGGPCFPRDSRAFAAFAEIHDYDAKLAKATDAVNDLQVSLMLERVKKAVDQKQKTGATVAVLGLAYKPNTPVVEESPGIKIIEALLQQGDYNVVVYDQLAVPETQKVFGDKIRYAHTAKEASGQADVSIVATMESEFKGLNADAFKAGSTVVDCWRMLNRESLQAHVDYVSIGYCS